MTQPRLNEELVAFSDAASGRIVEFSRRKTVRWIDPRSISTRSPDQFATVSISGESSSDVAKKETFVITNAVLGEMIYESVFSDSATLLWSVETVPTVHMATSDLERRRATHEKQLRRSRSVRDKDRDRLPPVIDD